MVHDEHFWTMLRVGTSVIPAQQGRISKARPTLLRTLGRADLTPSNSGIVEAQGFGRRRDLASLRDGLGNSYPVESSSG
jgi:hypothetical protein